MPDDVLIESVSHQAFLWSEQLELWPWHEPQQISFATAMRAIALHGFFQAALDFDGYLPAVTATFVVHLLAPKSGRYSAA
jgi:hypothetical protein